MKKKISISVTEDTVARLKQYALEHHTSVSQAVTDLIWQTKVKGSETFPGQMHMKDLWDMGDMDYDE